jgi:type IV pilus assembly protein PilN
MMIRINLLPVRQVKKREMGRQVLILFGVVLVLGVLLNYLWYSSRSSVQEGASRKLAATRQQIAELEKVIGEVNNLNKRKEEVEKKLTVLGNLRKSRAGPVKMMDALATATPKKVWLKDFEEKQNAVRLSGTAMSHDDVAELMRGLGTVVWTPKGMARLVEQKRDAHVSRVELVGAEGATEDFPTPEISPFFSRIDLKKAEQQQTKEAGPAGTVVNFEITLSANYAI